jgi:hypothetical protein
MSLDASTAERPDRRTATQAFRAGDMIQLDTWFCDVWAEVVSAFGEPGDQLISFCVYSKRGDERWLRSCFGRDVRRHVKGGAGDVAGMRCRGSVLYFADQYFGGFGQEAHWSTRLNAGSRAHSNWPERMQGGRLVGRWPDRVANDEPSAA